MLHFRFSIWAACLSSAATTVTTTAAAAAASNGSLVDLGYSKYQGVRNETLDITTYYGIPYAVPPTGALRWQPPQPIQGSTSYANSTIIDATMPGPQCHQGTPLWFYSPNNVISYSQQEVVSQPDNEDCLRLDVHVPFDPLYPTLPVAILIHGGGYGLGYSVYPDGRFFTSHANGSIIFVSIQYRLGVYGFLSGSAVKNSGTANAGLLDQRLAIQWVKTNIARFGGDPNRITIWGNSAGGGSVTNQLMLYGGESQPPFRAAIADWPWWQPYHDDDILELQYNNLLNASNCDDLACLRNLPEPELARAQQTVFNISYTAGSYGYGDFFFGPSVDGQIVQDRPSRMFQGGNFSKVPTLTTREGYEGVIFSNVSINQESQVQADLQRVWPQANDTFFSELFELYPSSAFTGSYFADPILSTYAEREPRTSMNSAFYQRQAIFGDAFINCPSNIIATAVTQAGQPAYKLRSNAGTELHNSVYDFLFSPYEATPNATIAMQLTNYYVSFITSLNPNAPSDVQRPVWPFYYFDNQVLEVNMQNTTTATDEDAGEKCAFFARYGNVIRN